MADDTSVQDASSQQEAHELGQVMSMIMTTSPIPTCPAIDMISITLDSIYRNPQMREVKLFLVCDGSKVVQKKNAYRSGRVTAEAQEKYVQYKANLKAEIDAARYPFHNAQLVALEERQGFGFAVREVMPLITTPVVLVAQHDRAFFRDVDIYGSVQLLFRFPTRYKYIGYHTKSTRSYRQQMVSSYPSFKDHMNYERHRLLRNGDPGDFEGLFGDGLGGSGERVGLDSDATLRRPQGETVQDSSLPMLARQYKFSRAALSIKSSSAVARVPKSHTEFSWLHSFSNRVHGASKTWRAGAPSSHTNFSWFKTDLRRDAAYTNMPVGKHEREEAYVAAMASELEPEDFVPDTGHHNTATSGQAAKFKRKGRQMDVPSSSKSDESGDEVGGNTVASLGGGTGRLLTLLPMVYWYDSMHVALTDYYNHFVYEKDVMHRNRVLRVQRGGFIEDKLGQRQREETLAEGVSAHRRYGTWILDDRDTAPNADFPATDSKSDGKNKSHGPLEQRTSEQLHNDAVGHLHGRKFAKGGFHHNKLINVQRNSEPGHAAAAVTAIESKDNSSESAAKREESLTADNQDPSTTERPESISMPMRTRWRQAQHNPTHRVVRSHHQVAHGIHHNTPPNAKKHSVDRRSTELDEYTAVINTPKGDNAAPKRNDCCNVL